MCSTEKKQPSDLRVDQAGSSTPFAGVLQLLALTPWHCHHQYPAAFSLDTCISLTNTVETNPRWGAVTALVYPPSCLPFWSRFGATSGGKVEIWMCLLRECAYVPADTYLYEDGHSQQRFVLLFICSKLEPEGFPQSFSTACKSQSSAWQLPSLTKLVSDGWPPSLSNF